MTNGKGQHKPPPAVREDFGRSTLFVTIASVIVAVVATGAAFWSSWEAHKTRVNDERPLLVASPPDDPPPPAPFIKIRIKNFGKSSAKNIRVSCKSAIDAPDSPAIWDPKEADSPTDTFPYLQPEIWVLVDCPSSSAQATLNKATAVELGTIKYEDLEGAPYTTPFCLTFTVPYAKVDIHQCSTTRNLPELK